MFWAGGPFHVAWTAQRQSENPIMPNPPNVRVIEQASAKCEENWKASSSPQQIGAKQSSAKAMAEDFVGSGLDRF